MRHAAIGLLLAAVCYFANVARAAACSCVESAGVSEDLTASGSVFEGKVTRLRHEPKHHRLTARVQVLRRWKGAASASVDVVTVDEGSLCGFGFAQGKSYLLFTPESEGTLSVSLCSRSKPSESAAADFAELDRLAAGSNAPPAASSAPAGPSAPAPPVAPPGQPTPSPSPPPTTAPEPTTAAPQPARGGCAGCAASAATPPEGHVAALIALMLGGFVRRRAARTASNAPGVPGHPAFDERQRRTALYAGAANR